MLYGKCNGPQAPPDPVDAHPQVHGAALLRAGVRFHDCCSRGERQIWRYNFWDGGDDHERSDLKMGENATDYVSLLISQFGEQIWTSIQILIVIISIM